MNIQETPLVLAVENLYNTFAAYPRFQSIRECTHCIDEASQEALQPIPLREIPAQQFWTFAFNMSVMTWGKLSDYKHFLPRILELSLLALGGDFVFVDIEIILGGLHHHNWTTWPRREQEAINDLFATLWQFLADTWRFDWLTEQEVNIIEISDVSDLICALCRAYRQVPPFITSCITTAKPSAMVLLADFIYESSDDLVKKRTLTKAFWKEPFLGSMLQFLCQPLVRQRLREAEDFFAEEADERRFLDGSVEILHKFCTASSQE